MAEPQALAALKAGIGTWNAYHEQHPIPDLSEANLTRANLVRFTLGDTRMSGANLYKADLVGADLDGANLTGSKLTGSNLVGADLTRANLAKANLTGADLSDANLAKANLTRADLAGANLDGANLTGANLNRANMTGANLHDANLAKANLARAIMTAATFAGTQLGNVDLSKTEGLHDVVHEGPSTLGVDTLYRSRGEIPDVFIRGVGLTNLFITYARDTINAEAGTAFAYYSAFLSHSHADREPVRAIYEQLTARGIPCWLDEHQLLPGDLVDAHVDAAIKGADKVVVFCSKASLSPGTGWWVNREIGRALEQEARRSIQQLKNVPLLVPVDLDGYLFSDGCDHPRKADLTERIIAAHRPSQDPTEPLVKALSTHHARPYAPHFDRARRRP